MNVPSDVARAKKAVHGRLGFYIHLTAFLIVNALLIFINLTTSSEHLWFQWPLCGWGIGLVAHAAAIFGLPGIRNRMIEKELKHRATRN